MRVTQTEYIRKYRRIIVEKIVFDMPMWKSNGILETWIDLYICEKQSHVPTLFENVGLFLS